MNIKPFAVEEWMNGYEDGARYNIAETCVNSMSLDELFEITGADREGFLKRLCARRLGYGDITGAPELKEGICSLYRALTPEQVVTTHGAAGGNHHVFYSLIEPGDRVVSVVPTYQQLYSIPESYGAQVSLLPLRAEDGYLPDLAQLRRLAVTGTKLICINNPNNPTGALMPDAMLEQIADIARSAGAYVLCDEAYRHLTQNGEWSASMADIYEKGISVGSMSKVFSLAGLRLGWIASRDRAFMEQCLSHRDYDHISCGVFDEAVAALALQNSGAIIGRNRRIIREQLEILDAWVASEPRLSYVRPAAGTTALVRYDLDIPSYEFCRRMYGETGAFVTPGDCFGQERSMRIGYAGDRQTLLSGLAAVSRFIAAL